MGSFDFTDQQQQQQQQQPELQAPPEGSGDKNGLNALPFLGQIHTSPLLSRPMDPIGRAYPPTIPPMGDSDGFNAVPQMASMGPPPVLSSLWTGGASPDSRGDYYDGPHEEYSDGRYDYSMPTEEDQEEESCSCQSQTCQSQSELSSIERTESDSKWEELSDGPSPRVSLLESLGAVVLSTMQPEHRQRMVALYHLVLETAVVKVVLLVLQMLCCAVFWLVEKTVGVNETVGSRRLRLWNSKFKLRTIQRQMLWRMANARGDETLVFFAVLMTTPWLFSLSLLGFILSLAALLKKTVEELVFQIRLHIVL
ncbi:uncharacterized protein LOC113567198 [Drosophila persimilis]|uniref:uncharacterized protein LOC113567198 n=1 Tax=Drosophila persimilis TaxID=7234 RepID=UPI000F09295F|nr:uncharacterized protein LOC113567198 [Drosophila persimilis]